MEKNYKVVGLMSGTSLDGVDIAYCEFSFNGKWTFKIHHSITEVYDERWKKELVEINKSTAEEISKANFDYGSHLGELVKNFCKQFSLTPDFISSHGHTIFHQPGKSFTLQLGSGAALAAHSGYSVISDFRSLDVALGGQGAPLVPIGDKLLFSEYDYCLNLGGIANISFEKNNRRLAFDICVCNLALNYLANKSGMSYDDSGLLARAGKVSQQMLHDLNELKYYSAPNPKSLGREDVEEDIFPIIERFRLSTEDALATLCEHIAIQISKCIVDGDRKKKMLVTGGGAFNKFLIQRISSNSGVEVVVPSGEIINFKEALIFAFLGVLRIREESNCLADVTGASKDNCGGSIYFNK